MMPIDPIRGLGQYAPVNGLNMYFEICGAGQPLVLIPGGFGHVGVFTRLIPQLAARRQVITVELQGHGHTADLGRPFSFEQFADDIAALIEHLNLPCADVMGWSLGGGVALQTVIRHPALVRKLVVLSAPYKRAGWFPDVLAGMASIEPANMIGSPMHTAYVNVAPHPEDFPNLANKTRQLLGQDYDWTDAVTAVTTPVLIVAADADSLAPAYAAEMFGLLGGGKKDAGWDGSGMIHSQLAILPGTTHYNSVDSPCLAGMVNEFLDAPIRQLTT